MPVPPIASPAEPAAVSVEKQAAQQTMPDYNLSKWPRPRPALHIGVSGTDSKPHCSRHLRLSEPEGIFADSWLPSRLPRLFRKTCFPQTKLTLRAAESLPRTACHTEGLR